MSHSDGFYLKMEVAIPTTAIAAVMDGLAKMQQPPQVPWNRLISVLEKALEAVNSLKEETQEEDLEDQEEIHFTDEEREYEEEYPEGEEYQEEANETNWNGNNFREKDSEAFDVKSIVDAVLPLVMKQFTSGN
jgi:hypothetical protein